LNAVDPAVCEQGFCVVEQDFAEERRLHGRSPSRSTAPGNE
jgi:hypothetical protein